MLSTRRKFFAFLAGAVAAPAIVKADGLMKIAGQKLILPDQLSLRELTAYQIGADQEVTRLDVLYGWLDSPPLVERWLQLSDGTIAYDCAPAGAELEPLITGPVMTATPLTPDEVLRAEQDYYFDVVRARSLARRSPQHLLSEHGLKLGSRQFHVDLVKMPYDLGAPDNLQSYQRAEAYGHLNLKQLIRG